MRVYDYNSGGKTIAASTTIQFTNSDIPSNQVGAYYLAFTGSGNTWTNVSRVRVKANNTTLFDFAPEFLRAWIQCFTHGNVTYPKNTAQDPLGAGTAGDFRRMTIPFFDPSQPTEDAQDLFQFPRNSQVTLEVVFGSGAGAGTCFCGWMESDRKPIGFPKFVGAQMNISASQATSKYQFSEEATVKAFVLNTIGNTRTRIQVDGAQVYHMQGQATASSTVTADSLVLESMQLDSPCTGIAAGTAAVPNNLTNPYCIKLPQDRPATPGRSFVELSTDSNWGGVTNEGYVFSQYIYSEFRGKRVLQSAAS